MEDEKRAENGTRTRYLQLGKLSLYQVSYFRVIANIKFLPECAKILFNYAFRKFQTSPKESLGQTLNLKL